jgi:hypothetical protein
VPNAVVKLRHVTLVAASLLLLPLAAPSAAAPAPYVYYQGRAGAFVGFYSTLYGNGSYDQAIVDPAFLNQIPLGRESFEQQTVPVTDHQPVGSGVARSVNPKFSYILPIDANTTFPIFGELTSSFAVSAFPGAVHSVVSVIGQINPVSYTYVDPVNGTTIIPNYAVGHGVAFANVTLHDFITVGSSSTSLHVGDPVTVRLTGTLHSAVVDPEANASYGDATYVYGIFGLNDQFISMLDGDGVIRPHLAQRTQFIDVPLHVGDVVELIQSLNSGAEGVVNFGTPSVDNHADAGNTALTRLDSLTPGATLVSSSGFDYTAVPEPASLGTLAAALALFVPRQRRVARRGESHLEV